MHLGRRRENDSVGSFDALREITGVMRNAVFLRNLSGRVLIAANERGDLHFRNTLQGVQVLLSEGTLAGNTDLHHSTSPNVDCLARGGALDLGDLGDLGDLA